MKLPKTEIRLSFPLKPIDLKGLPHENVFGNNTVNSLPDPRVRLKAYWQF